MRREKLATKIFLLLSVFAVLYLVGHVLYAIVY